LETVIEELAGRIGRAANHKMGAGCVESLPSGMGRASGTFLRTLYLLLGQSAGRYPNYGGPPHVVIRVEKRGGPVDRL
jgi:hypothetical protein